MGALPPSPSGWSCPSGWAPGEQGPHSPRPPPWHSPCRAIRADNQGLPAWPGHLRGLQCDGPAWPGAALTSIWSLVPTGPSRVQEARTRQVWGNSCGRKLGAGLHRGYQGRDPSGPEPCGRGSSHLRGWRAGPSPTEPLSVGQGAGWDWVRLEWDVGGREPMGTCALCATLSPRGACVGWAGTVGHQGGAWGQRGGATRWLAALSFLTGVTVHIPYPSRPGTGTGTGTGALPLRGLPRHSPPPGSKQGLSWGP